MTKKKPQSKKLALARLRSKKFAVRRGLLATRLGAGLALLAVAFLAYFSLAHATLAPIYAGKLPVSSAVSTQALERQITAAAANHLLTVSYPDKTKKSFALSEIGVTIDVNSSAKNIKQYIDHHLLERLAWWQPIELPLAIKTDQPKLAYFIGNKARVVSAPPVNASLTAEGGKATIVPEAFGNGFGLKNAEQVIPRRIAALSDQPLTLAPQKLAPAISAQNLEPTKLKLARMLGQKVSFKLGQKTVIATTSDLAEWIEVTPVIKDKTADLAVNSGKIAEYLERITAGVIQPPRSRVVMEAASGETVLDPGSAGIDITQKDETAAAAAVATQKGEGYSAELPVTYLAAKTVRVPQAAKVLVVDTTTKRMYAYQDTTLVKTVLVSAGAPKTPTVMGQYAIYAKYAVQDMRGANADGSRYFQAGVPYVNYFYKDYAIHGNYWRGTDYFGNINSSHGCVGITPGDGKWIYDWAPIGTPVIVHD